MEILILLFDKTLEEDSCSFFSDDGFGLAVPLLTCPGAGLEPLLSVLGNPVCRLNSLMFTSSGTDLKEDIEASESLELFLDLLKTRILQEPILNTDENHNMIEFD